MLKDSIFNKTVENIKRFGGDPKLTIFEGVGHDAWRYAYTDELVNWFMEHKKAPQSRSVFGSPYIK